MTLDELRTHPLPLARHAYWAMLANASVGASMKLSEHKKILWTAEQDAVLIAAHAQNPKRYLSIVAAKTGRTTNACHHRMKQLMGKGK